MSRSDSEEERAELARALEALAADSPARKPLLEALAALDTRRSTERHSGPPAPSRRLGSSARALVVVAVLVVVAATAFFTRTAVVPVVVDEERSFAAGALRSAGFDINVRTRADGDVREGHVLEQSPAGGSRVRKGSQITLVVSELPSFALNGTFTLFDSTGGTSTNCYGRGGYSDIESGVAVTVKDGFGTILATGSLGNGQRSAAGGSCRFPFRIRDVKQSDFYSIEVGRRGSLSYSHSEMLANNWEVAFSLG